MTMESMTELQRNAIFDARRKELDTFQRALDVQWLNSRMEDGRMGRCLALIQREADMEKEFQERTDHAAIVNSRAEKEAALGLEIAKVRGEEACTLLRRHYLRERDPELRELCRRLKAGYVCRDLKQQILHNEYRKLQDKAEESRTNTILKDSIHSDMEQKEREDHEKLQQTSRYRLELQQQLVHRQKERQCSYEESLIEKKMLDEVMRTISDEDQRELQQKRETTERMRREMVTSQRARAAWREKQKGMVVLEEKEIEKQRQALSNRSAAVIAERQRKLREKEEINARIANKIMADEAERQKREDLIKLLQEQEYLEKNVQETLEEKQKLDAVRRETMRALTSQVEVQRRSVEDQRRRDQLFRKEVEAKLQVDEEKEREKQRKLREKNRLYSTELLRQIEQNRARRERDGEMEAARAERVFRCDSQWQSEVQEERKQIITEHAPHLLGCLRAGVIREGELGSLPGGAGGRTGPPGTTRPRRFPKCNEQCQIIRKY